jgi:hypothetical protein
MLLIPEIRQYDPAARRWGTKLATNEWSLHGMDNPIGEILVGTKKVPYFAAFDIVLIQGGDTCTVE